MKVELKTLDTEFYMETKLLRRTLQVGNSKKYVIYDK